MNLYFRLLRAYLNGLISGRLSHTETSESRFRVWLHDLDAFGHMNNGRYLQIMDVARTEWMTRVGVFSALRQHNWTALLGGGIVRFRYSLRAFEQYRVRTRLLHWDSRWFYLEHAFMDKDDRCVAAGVTRAGIRGSGEWVPASRMAAAVGADADRAPAPPGYLRAWLELEDELFAAAAGHATSSRSGTATGGLH